MKTEDLYEKCARRGLDPVAVEFLRTAMGRSFTVVHRRRESLAGFDTEELRDRALRGLFPKLDRVEPMIVMGRDSGHNIVTNEGLNHILDSALSAATQITAWKVAVSKTNTTPLSTHTYASPGYTEASTSNLIEANRQAWTDGGVSSQSMSNTASPAVYTAEDSWTAYGVGLVGGGSGAATIANTAGGGTLYSSYLLGTSKALVATDTITITYTETAADDGV